MNPRTAHAATKTISSVLAGLMSVGSYGALGSRVWAAEAESGVDVKTSSESGNRLLKTMAVLSLHIDEEEARESARIGVEAEQVVEELHQQQLLSLVQLFDESGRARLQANAQEAAKALQEAQKLYQDLDPDASEQCDRALQTYENSDLSTQFESFMSAWKWRIAALIANARVDLAGSELNLLLPAAPDATFDPNIFSPDFISQVQRKRKSLLSRSDLSYRISTAPVPARVYIDGRFRGITPLEVENLAPGEHFLTLHSEGYGHYQKRIRPGGEGAEAIRLEAVPGREQYSSFVASWKRGPTKKEQNAAAISLARALKVDQLLVLVLSKKNKGFFLQGTRIDALAGLEIAVAGVEIPLEGKQQSNLVRAVVKDLLNNEKSPTMVATSGWTSRHTGYAMMGVGVAAAGAGIFLGLRARTIDREIVGLDVPDSSLEQKKSTRKRYAVAADICYLTSLIAAGVGVYYALKAPDSTVKSNEGQEVLPASRTSP